MLEQILRQTRKLIDVIDVSTLSLVTRRWPHRPRWPPAMSAGVAGDAVAATTCWTQRRIARARTASTTWPRESALEPCAAAVARGWAGSVLLKREDQQPVFSFKLRGAYNRMVQLDAGSARAA